MGWTKLEDNFPLQTGRNVGLLHVGLLQGVFTSVGWKTIASRLAAIATRVEAIFGVRGPSLDRPSKAKRKANSLHVREAPEARCKPTTKYRGSMWQLSEKTHAK